MAKPLEGTGSHCERNYRISQVSNEVYFREIEVSINVCIVDEIEPRHNAIRNRRLKHYRDECTTRTRRKVAVYVVPILRDGQHLITDRTVFVVYERGVIVNKRKVRFRLDERSIGVAIAECR